MNPLLKNFISVILILLVIGAVFSLLYYPASEPTKISVTQLVSDINQDKIKKIVENGDVLTITYADNTTAKSMKEVNVGLAASLDIFGVNKDNLKKVEIDIQPVQESVWSWLTPILIFGILLLIVFGFFFWTMIKQAKSGAMQAFDFTKARARIFGAEGHGKEKITFKNVARFKKAKKKLI